MAWAEAEALFGLAQSQAEDSRKWRNWKLIEYDTHTHIYIYHMYIYIYHMYIYIYHVYIYITCIYIYNMYVYIYM